MTQEEFEAVLALEGRKLVAIPVGPHCVARVVEDINVNDVDEGPYRNPGMTRTILEIVTDQDFDSTIATLIGAYLAGGYRK